METIKNELIFLTPIYKQMIWGGERLKNIFEEIDINQIGETWVVASLGNDQSIVSNGIFQGLTLSELYSMHNELFGYFPSENFPLLIKYIDAKSNLSIQVHPDDSHALNLENCTGKSEFWLVLEADDKAELILGHNYKNKEEFKDAILNKTIENGLNLFRIRKNLSFYIPAGTVHAICKNSIIYEVQQNSNITYRIYDYGRKDVYGNERELHIDKAVEVSDIPMKPIIKNKLNLIENELEIICDEEYFRIESLLIERTFKYTCNDWFYIVGCLFGEGEINGFKVKNGDHILIPHHVKELDIKGCIHLVISIPKINTFVA